MAGMTQCSDTWQDYWQADRFWRDCTLWEVNAELFLAVAREIVGFGPEDRVLNVGCGAGHLERRLAPSVREILAVDTAEQFVDLCRERCRGQANVTVSRLGSDYTDLTQLGRSFTRVLLVSVVQYYRDLAELEALIRSARQVASPGGRILIADLPLRRGLLRFARDGVDSFWQSLRHGYAVPLLQTAARRWLWRSSYSSFTGQRPELRFTSCQLRELARRLGPAARIIDRSMSVYANRPSLLIQC
jgi:SAM-dependent methyltransferase